MVDFDFGRLLAPMRPVIVMLALFFPANSALAANATVKDGATLQIAGVTYRLDGVDAPEFDQICLDDHADPWTCGVEARDQLAKLIGRARLSIARTWEPTRSFPSATPAFAPSRAMPRA